MADSEHAGGLSHWGHHGRRHHADPVIGWWLAVCCLLVVSMILLGAVTRLTDSGLSMVEWRPVTGWLPPLSEQAWLAAFEKYKAFPEFQKVNQFMDLAGFKEIYAFEYAHRLLGRLIGLSFALPLLYFLLIAKRIPWDQAGKYLFLFVLGGLQGGVGWFMVKSGLVDHPDVSQYRLTLHLGVAVLILCAMVWVMLGHFFPPERQTYGLGTQKPLWFALLVTVAVYFQILSGGFVAGIDAGFAYNTFPDMDGHFMPPEAYGLTPWWRNVFEDIPTVQFNHRLGAYCVITLCLGLWGYLRGHVHPLSRATIALNLVLTVLVLQVTLGISTLLWVVPVPLAAAHQGGGLLLITALVHLIHTLRYEDYAL